MKLTSEQIEKALSDGYRQSIGILIGLTLGGALAAGACYGVTRFGLDPDFATFGIVVAVFIGWVIVALRARSFTTRAKKIAEVLSQPGVKIHFNGSRLVFEQIGEIEVGGSAVEATIARVELTVEEAHRIGFMQKSGSRGLLLQNSSDELPTDPTTVSNRRPTAQVDTTVDGDLSAARPANAT